jgi:CRISPR-associated protein Csb2
MSLILSIRFPTERYVAATMTQRDKVEWPPHPARLILGLLAAHHLGDAVAAEHDALQWLCEQPAPEVLLPPAEHCISLHMAGVYVPQNLAHHSRKERSFPSMILPPDQAEILFHWPFAEPEEATRTALASLASKLIRFGHSSSLVMAAWVNKIPAGDWQRLLPQTTNDVGSPDHRLRVPWSGLIASAELAYDAKAREEELAAAFKRRDDAAAKGRPLTKFEASPRGRYDARHETCGYSIYSPETLYRSPWERSFFILSRTGGSTLGLESTWQITSVLHRTILDRWSRNPDFGPVPAWISGHESGNGGSTASVRHNHLAMFPLAHVDSSHASGRILGIGFAMPRATAIGMDKATLRIHWRQLLSCLFEQEKMTLAPQDHAWSLELAMADGDDTRQALQPTRWNAAATQWKTVTPIILDRHPKPTFAKDPQAWRESCVEIIAEACLRSGLPAQVCIEPSVHSLMPGSLAASSFKPPVQRVGRPARFHIHATITFAEKVEGPLLIGAGRFRGYGLLKPSKTKTS